MDLRKLLDKEQKLYVKLNIQRFAATVTTHTLTEDSYSTSANTSTVTYKVVVTTTGESYNNTSGNTATYYIDGTKYTTSFKLPKTTATTVIDKTVTITHDTDGSKTITASYSIPTGISAGTLTGSKTLALTTTSRYFSSTPTISLSDRTETTQKYTWKTSETCSKIVYYYKKSSASSYSSSSSTVSATSGTFTLSGLSADTSYNVYIVATRSDSGLTTQSSTATNSTYQYPYVSKVGTSSLTIGNSQTLTLYNPLGRSCSVYMKQNSTSGTTLYSGTTSSTSITFTPSSSTLYSSIPSATSGTAVYYCTYSSQTVQTLSGTYSIVSSSCTPTLSGGMTYRDTNTTITDITADDQIIVQNQSTFALTLPTATALNSATISNLTVTIDSISKTYTSSSAGTEVSLGAISGSGDKTLKVTVVDSRGLTASSSKSIYVYPYASPTVNATATRTNNYENETTLKVSGSYSLFDWVKEE